MAKIAVEDTLSDIKDTLKEQGYEVVSLEPEQIKNCDCYVISGQDKDVMGISDLTTEASIINAEGMTAEEVVTQVNQRLKVATGQS